MQKDELIRSRVHRILRKAQGFLLLDAKSHPDIVNKLEIKLNPEEEVLGLYQNSPIDLQQNIMITNKGIHTFTDHWIFIAYEAMNRVKVLIPEGTEKRDAKEIIIPLKTGGEIIVPIRGGRNNTRDVWSVDRFLVRVIADVEKHSND